MAAVSYQRKNAYYKDCPNTMLCFSKRNKGVICHCSSNVMK
jgi:hypothetical protein